MQCHNKGITDFEFLGSCSLITTSKRRNEDSAEYFSDNSIILQLDTVRRIKTWACGIHFYLRRKLWSHVSTSTEIVISGLGHVIEWMDFSF